MIRVRGSRIYENYCIQMVLSVFSDEKKTSSSYHSLGWPYRSPSPPGNEIYIQLSFERDLPHQIWTTTTYRPKNKKVGYRPRFCQFPFGSRTILFYVFGETDRSDITFFFSAIFFLDLNGFLVACYATLFVTMLVGQLVCLSVCLIF